MSNAKLARVSGWELWLITDLIGGLALPIFFAQKYIFCYNSGNNPIYMIEIRRGLDALKNFKVSGAKNEGPNQVEKKVADVQQLDRNRAQSIVAYAEIEVGSARQTTNRLSEIIGRSRKRDVFGDLKILFPNMAELPSKAKHELNEILKQGFMAESAHWLSLTRRKAVKHSDFPVAEKLKRAGDFAAKAGVSLAEVANKFNLRDLSLGNE